MRYYNKITIAPGSTAMVHPFPPPFSPSTSLLLLLHKRCIYPHTKSVQETETFASEIFVLRIIFVLSHSPSQIATSIRATKRERQEQPKTQFSSTKTVTKCTTLQGVPYVLSCLQFFQLVDVLIIWHCKYMCVFLTSVKNHHSNYLIVSQPLDSKTGS